MKKFLFIVLILIIGFTLAFKNDIPTTDPHDFGVKAKAIILIDAETGKVLYEENSTESLPIASMSKMMTQYLVLNSIQNGSLSWNSEYSPSEYVREMTSESAVVRLGMSNNRTYTVKELFTAMTVTSANDAAIALAEMVSGSEEAFVDLMNKQAKAFKLKKTIFYNASGLDGDYVGKSKDETNLSSAKDVSIIAQQLIAKYPEVLDFTKITNFTTTDGHQLWSTNSMLPGMPMAVGEIDGMKTGYTEMAGPCFTSTGVFDGRRIISVVMDVEADGNDKTNPKFQLTEELIAQFVVNQ
ncbi:D-alanyl-D-alanine carboxypeptidase [Sporosarcina sp. Marseille-Q4063]|uniref:serine hydrolase n=1 Tax=Sporosarcina sp. Marseille-Q4063 TaxID=2810514 RepID=UPI001BAFA341|nr:serine hydrolase [Sporosarcina sp. Marseille-Q4063]QUW20532.1 D-alanyl-D-alanine carboxypeptidase [Sporosarcina sp. Marseille-Q4063]